MQFIKIPNCLVKQTLDPAQFGNKDNLSIHEWWQAYRTWLSLIDIIADTHVAVGWHEHHDKMWADDAFSHSARAWHTHDKQMCTQFVARPFILDPKGSIYCQGLMRAWTDMALAALIANHRPHSS